MGGSHIGTGGDRYLMANRPSAGSRATRQPWTTRTAGGRRPGWEQWRLRVDPGPSPGRARAARVAPIPAVRMTTGPARVDPKSTLTAAGHGSLTALTLTAMGRLPKLLPAIK